MRPGRGGERLHHWVFGGPWHYDDPARGTALPEEVEPDRGFLAAPGLDEALALADDLAGERQIHLMGGDDVIRQALAAGRVDELTLVVAPCLLGDGKRLFADIGPGRDLEPLEVRRSPLATFLRYRLDGAGEAA